MTAFAQWLAGTSASMVVQKTLWLIPLMQTIHIVCVALVFSSVVMIEFRILGYSKAGRWPTPHGVSCRGFTPASPSWR